MQSENQATQKTFKSKLRQIKIFIIPIRLGREFLASIDKVEKGWQRDQYYATSIRSRDEVIRNYLANHEIKKLNIGAGRFPLNGWLNTDLEPAAANVIYLDATQPFPLPGDQFNYVYSEHMIEHIHYKNGLFMLAEIYRIIKPGGKLRISTPNVERITSLLSAELSELQRRYVEWSATEMLGLYSPQRSKLQEHRPEWDIESKHFVDHFPQKQNDPACFVVNNFFRSYGHLFLYNPLTLNAAMESSGFVDVRQVSPYESSDIDLQNLESHADLIGKERNVYETMVLEGTKPVPE